MKCKIRRKSVCLALYAIAWACAGYVHASPDADAIPRPKAVVLIYADDLGYGSLSSYGADKVRTPRIDSLADEGLRLTDAHSPASVCSPSRYALLTGRYCWRTSLKDRVLAPQAPLHIEADRPTLASLLRDQGYHTAVVGKWHLGLGDPPETDWNDEPIRPGPEAAGFDYSFIIPGSNNFPPSVYIENGHVVGRKPGERIELALPRDGRGTPGWKLWEKETIEDTWEATEMGLLLAEKAAAYIEERAAGDEPFFLYFPAPQPHLPLTPNERFQGTSEAGAYGDFIRELDWMTGRILDALESAGLLDESLVLFTSDNGGVERLGERHGLATNGPWRGSKGQIWEGGHRMPFLVRWPGVVPAGADSDAVVSQVDLFASLHALFGEPVPLGAGEDSWNRLDALLGRPDPAPGRPMVHHSAQGMFALRVGPWKYIEGQGPGGAYTAADLKRIRRMAPRQLYNLEADPDESDNLYLEKPGIVDQMQAALDRIRENPDASKQPVELDI